MQIFDQPEPNREPYTLNYYDQRLVSISTTTYQQVTDNLKVIQEVRYLKKSLLNSYLLFKLEAGIYQSLLSKAQEIHPTQFQSITRELVRKHVIGYLEELHKLANGIISNSPRDILYALLNLQIGITEILFNHYNIFLETENDTFQSYIMALQQNGRADLVDLWYIMWQVEQSGDNMVERGKSALKLYLGLIDLVSEKLTQQEMAKLTVTKEIMSIF